MGHWSDSERVRAAEDRKRAYLVYLLCFMRVGLCSWCKREKGVGLRVKACESCRRALLAPRRNPVLR
jgi:hypothetical protein